MPRRSGAWGSGNTCSRAGSARRGALGRGARSPGGHSPPWHRQPGDDETFYVLDGETDFWVDDPSQTPQRADAGALVFIPAARRTRSRSLPVGRRQARGRATRAASRLDAMTPQPARPIARIGPAPVFFLLFRAGCRQSIGAPSSITWSPRTCTARRILHYDRPANTDSSHDHLPLPAPRRDRDRDRDPAITKHRVLADRRRTLPAWPSTLTPNER
ncbi:MAG: cupin domain-containing protein [Solirubrobacteraceae bacterium]